MLEQVLPQFRSASSGTRTVLPPTSGSPRVRRAQHCALDCTIPAASTREAVIWSRLEAPVKRKRALLCALTRSHPLLPFLSPRLSLSSLICFIPRSVRLDGGAHASGTVVSHCSPADRAPFGSALRGWVLRIYAVFFFSPPNECLCRRFLPHTLQPGDVPEHVHIRDGFTCEYAALTPSPRSPERALLVGLYRLSPKRKRENPGVQGWGSTAL